MAVRLVALAWVFGGQGLAGCGVGCVGDGEGPADAEAPRFEAAPLVTLASRACKPLLAGQTLVAGEICARVDGEDLVFRYRLTDGWQLGETRLWVGTSLADMPQTRTGNPKPGRFPWGGVASGSMAEVRVPLSTFGLSATLTRCPDAQAVVAAHASIRKVLADGATQQETAWGDGTRFTEQGSWSMWFGLTLRCGPTGPGPVCGEAAFAKHAQMHRCFIGSPWISQSNRWGWTNGPFPEGSYTFELWAAAADCMTERGWVVGRVELRYAAGTAEVRITAKPPFSFPGTQLYVGPEPLARSRGAYTLSPGLFPWQHTLSDAVEDRFVVTGLTGPVYLVLHAEACRRGGWGDHEVTPQ